MLTVNSLGQPKDERHSEVAVRSKILVVGNGDPAIHSVLLDGVAKAGYEAVVYPSAEHIDTELLDEAGLLLLFIDQIPQPALFAQVSLMLKRARDLAIVPIVGYDDQEKASALLELGCADYLLAPFSQKQLRALLQRQEHVRAAEESFVTSSPAGRRLLAMAQRVALTRAPILITGETGTGKELMARYIHRFSGADDAPFVAVNCAAIPAPMLESILFGHEKGAFTGAVTAQPGKFELANGGTLLLDEVGELPLELQAKLLRVLQEMRVERLGGRREIPLDVRIIAATNRDLQKEVAEGRFRADLLFRLDVLPLHIAPLRERREDILPLARRFIEKYAPEEASETLLTEEACRALLAHDWPGNVRELENTVQRALVLRKGLFIQPQDLGLEAPAQAEPAVSPPAPMTPEEARAGLRASGKMAEYQYIIDAISRFGGHKGKAAASLGITPRALRYRLKAMREQGVPMNSKWLGGDR